MQNDIWKLRRVMIFPFWLGHALRPTTECAFSTSQLPKVVRHFWLGNVLRAATVCNFSSLIWPNGSAPAALGAYNSTFRSHKALGKIQQVATYLPFHAPASSLFWPFLFSDLLPCILCSSLALRTSAFPSVWFDFYKLPSIKDSPSNLGPAVLFASIDFEFLLLRYSNIQTFFGHCRCLASTMIGCCFAHEAVMVPTSTWIVRAVSPTGGRGKHRLLPWQIWRK